MAHYIPFHSHCNNHIPFTLQHIAFHSICIATHCIPFPSHCNTSHFIHIATHHIPFHSHSNTSHSIPFTLQYITFYSIPFHSVPLFLCRELAEQCVDLERPGDFNQALMELGATVCTPRNPRCKDCPISISCLAYRKVRKERSQL